LFTQDELLGQLEQVGVPESVLSSSKKWTFSRRRLDYISKWGDSIKKAADEIRRICFDGEVFLDQIDTVVILANQIQMNNSKCKPNIAKY
jgi:hypothetical protein